MTRSEIHDSFSRRFGSEDERLLVAPAEIGKIETQFNVQLPASYCEFMEKQGAIQCPRLLFQIVDQKADLWPIACFWHLEDIIADTSLYIHGGMSAKLVGFASDSMGNLFGFDRAEISVKKDDAQVWFFDHDFCEVSVLAKTFDSWLECYLNLKDPA